MEKLSLVVDARKTRGNRTGVGNYLVSLLDSIDESQVNLERIEWNSPFGHLWAFFHFKFKRNSIYFSPESLIVPILVGKRAILTVHDLTPLRYPERHTKRNILIHSLLFRLACSRVGKLTVPTSSVLQDLLEYIPSVRSKSLVISEGSRFSYDNNAPQSKPSKKTRVLLSVGTIEPRKNILKLIEAFLKVSQVSPTRWELRIVGKMGWVTDDYKGKIVEYSKLPNVNWLGYIEDSSLSDEYQNADLVAYVSESEGFGLPVIEAMSAGTPILISSDPALVEVAAGSAIVVELGDNFEISLENTLLEIMTDSLDIKPYAESGIKVAASYSWISSGKKLIDLAKSLM
jgi:glycosyltransferase involved in cell wall biosynthesis